MPVDQIFTTPLPEPLVEAARPLIGIDDVLKPYVWVFYAAFVVAFLFTPIMRQIAIYYDIVDRPDGKRKMHARPVAYLGGIAVFAGFFAALAISQFVHWHQIPGVVMTDRIYIPMPIWIGAIIVVLLGLYDDVVHISPYWKILGQVVAAGALLSAGIGTQITKMFVLAVTIRTDNWFGFTVDPAIQESIIFATSAILTTAIVVFCCNAANLMDGLDGLCGGVTAIIAFGFVCLAVFIARSPILEPAHSAMSNINADALRVVLALALLGAALGFVPFNFNPASIFMGDAGSLFLGFSCALMIIMLGEREARWLLAACVMFSLPVLDTALAFARRKLAGRPLFSADKQHLHHQLVARGLSVKQAVLTAYGLAIFFVVAGFSMTMMRTRYAIAFYLIIFGYIVVAAYKMGMVHERAHRHAPHDRLPTEPAHAEGSSQSNGDTNGAGPHA
jgi:UDP-GlcNAc:undecaprenyl-phosphate/decaprenyl-phosphate GlcNAc-1-phosphate transferase